ncbi:MAG: polysaccharide biosynthesis/export family protein [Bacteroidia bacterium]|nr:polysaccharide biosynthesis/export family protein [Bacteroidia bacterium]
MTKNRTRILLALLSVVLIALSSCIPQRKVMLLQDKHKEGDTIARILDKITDRYVLRPNDQLFVQVVSPNPEMSRYFNLGMGNTSSSAMTTSSMGANIYAYDIDDSVRIEMPTVGFVSLKGCTLSEAKVKIQEAVSGYLTDFTLNVKLTSNSFVTLGEFGRQGMFTMRSPQLTIYEAIAMAGGMSVYAKRNEVQLMRRLEDGRVAIYDIDLLGRDIINSDLYYVYPNDVLYAKPSKVKVFGFGETLSFGLLSSSLSLVMSVISLILLSKD